MPVRRDKEDGKTPSRRASSLAGVILQPAFLNAVRTGVVARRFEAAVAASLGARQA